MASVLSTGSGTNIGGFCVSVYGATIENSYSVGANSSDNTKGFLGAKGGINNVLSSNYLDTLASGCNQSSVPEATIGKQQKCKPHQPLLAGILQMYGE